MRGKMKGNEEEMIEAGDFIMFYWIIFVDQSGC